MKNLRHSIIVIFSCVVMICSLALCAACKVDEKEEGHFVGDKFVSKNNKVIGSWFCTIPDDVEKPEGYEAVCNAQLYITVEYHENVGGYQMTINYWWGNRESRKQVVTESHGILLVEYQDVNLEDNQYLYRGGFETYANDGYIFTLSNDTSNISPLKAESVIDSSKVLNFSRTTVPLEEYIAQHKEWCERML